MILPWTRSSVAGRLLAVVGRRRPAAAPRHRPIVRTHSASAHSQSPTRPNINFQQEKIERATQLHHELEDLVQAHIKRVQEEQARPIYQGFFSFVKKNKGEMMSIAAAFVCTLLAYQIVGLRRYNQRLEKTVKDNEHELLEKQELLQSLTKTEFVKSIAEQINHEIQSDNSSNNRAIISWGGRKEKDYSEMVAITIQHALQKQIGDAGLTTEQKKERVMVRLQIAQDELLVKQLEANQAVKEENEESEIIEVLQKSTGEQVVKKRKFSM
jgi:hypothetical protein